MFRIARFADLCGVSAKTLREYDRLGIFRPVWVDPTTGYRSYSPAQLPEIRRIVALRDLGVSLAEIERVVSGGADLRGVLDERRAALDAERREVERRMAMLDIQVEAEHAAGGHDIVVRRVEAETVATLEAVDGDLERAFYLLESHVRDAGRRRARPPGALLHDTAEGPGRVDVFVPIIGSVASVGGVAMRRLPAVRAATVITRGSYSSLRAARRGLEDWIAASGTRAAGPLRILYLQFGAEPELGVSRDFLVDREADFVTELQQPIG